ncbi:methyl-CpG-binding domain-containing protein 4 [Sarocladium implicatum]|nr:methyl-CpG-binding domain-containing protein 4 [Sarocladium implicatum]
MSRVFGHDTLSLFEAEGDDLDYLANLIDSGIAPVAEVKQIVAQSIITGADNWQARISCARTIRDSHCAGPESLDGQDVLSFIPLVACPTGPVIPWARTDRAFAVAQDLAERSRQELVALQARKQSPKTELVRPPRVTKCAKAVHTSHYWGSAGDSHTGSSQVQTADSGCKARRTKTVRFQEGTDSSLLVHEGSYTASGSVPDANPSLWQPCATQAAVSPYFHASGTPGQPKSPRRPAPGIVSSVPFPTLDALGFGLVQERLAHEPFWLLIAVTFLIKTRGTVAIPVFEKVRSRFPTPAQIADSANSGALLDMIRPLGLAKSRLAFLQKYATGFLTSPPRAGLRYRVPGYDYREPSPAAGSSVMTPMEDCADAWEIGHLTKGKYALDSWRIFCRDELLGRAEDWNGRGREGEFQPEWMRVRPDDKELRACLRWMWMREGWDWDPRSGEKTLLRDELRRAVNEGRVEYDDAGELRILDSPR